MIIGEFTDVFPPELDGVGAVVSAYCRTFRKNPEDTCYYIAPEYPGREEQEDYPVLNYVGLPIPGETYRFGTPDVDLMFQKQLRGIELDIVHAHSPFTAGMLAAAVARRRNIPLVATFHSKYYDDFLKRTKSESLSKLAVQAIVEFYERCDEVWAVNHATGEVLSSYGYKGEIQIMPNGTNLWYPTDDDRRGAEERFGLKEKTVFLFVGQQNFKKNTRHILEAVKLYSESHSDFRMVFAGQGPDEQAMKDLAQELGIADRTSFVGHIMDRQILLGLYARADLLVFPSIYDNAPMVVREAAAAGTPALLVRGSCAAEGVTDGENGFLCDDSPESIAACMARALETADAVGAKARQTIPLAWDVVVAQARKRYADLIEQYRSGEKKRPMLWPIVSRDPELHWPQLPKELEEHWKQWSSRDWSLRDWLDSIYQ